MNTMKKILALALALIMVMGLATTAFAQEVGTKTDGTGSITITNPSKGETYGYVKVFDATVTGTEDGSIAYTGEIPEALQSVFEKDSAGNIKVIAGKTDEEVIDAVQAWAKTQPLQGETISDGTPLTFNGLGYGYYAVISSQGQTVSVNSTNPDVSVTDKNSTDPEPPVKVVDDDNVKIGDTVTYTVTFKTANYDGTKKIVSYTIEDTLPAFLANVTVTSITVDGDPITTQQFEDKKITIDWVDDEGNHIYENGAEVVITYTAVVTAESAVDGAGNTNKVTMTWRDEDGNEPGEYIDEETIYTYALALKKVDQAGNPLAGATFRFPFYVQETPDEDGAYIYAGEQSGEGLINEITTPDDGMIIVKGLEAGTEIEIIETEAPNGYNKLTETVKVTPVKTGETTTHSTFYLDENGNIVDEETETVVTVVSENIAATAIVVVNKTGTELPETGGMGTTMFYVFGAVLLLGAAVLLITKRRVNMAQ